MAAVVALTPGSGLTTSEGSAPGALAQPETDDYQQARLSL